MRHHPCAEGLGAGDDVEHARRQKVGDDPRGVQRSNGGKRRWLHDQRVAGQEGGSEFQGEHEHRAVPRRDRRNDADRSVRDDYALFGIVGQHHIVDPLLGEPTQVRDEPLDLEAGQVKRLSQLLRHYDGEVFDVLSQPVGSSDQHRSPVIDRRRGPLWERTVCCGKGCIQLFPAACRNLGYDLAGRGVFDIEELVRDNLLSVDDHSRFVLHTSGCQCIAPVLFSIR